MFGFSAFAEAPFSSIPASGVVEDVISSRAKSKFTYRGGRLAKRPSSTTSFVQFLPDDFIDQEAIEIPRIKLTAPDQSAKIIQAYLDDIKATEKKQAKSKQQRIAKQASQERAINALAKRLAKEAMRLAELSKQKMLELQQQEDEMILQLLFEMV